MENAKSGHAILEADVLDHEIYSGVWHAQRVYSLANFGLILELRSPRCADENRPLLV
jgi:hypothetical protein